MSSSYSEIILFTRSFPFGKEETFLETEIQYLSKKFQVVYIIPLEKREGERSVPENVVVFEPMYSGKKKLEVLLKSFYVFRSLKMTLEIFKAFPNFRKIKQIVIVSWMDNYLKQVPRKILDNSLWYFYWGVNQASYLIFYNVLNRTVVRFHGYDLWEHTHRIPYRRKLLKKISSAICVSNAGLEHLTKRYPDFSHKISVFKLGTFDNGLSPVIEGKTARTIVSCSNVIPLKRVHLIAEALKFIRENVHWIHFGDGPGFSELQKAVNILPGNITVDLRGRVANSEVLRFYADNHVDIFINVSSSEGIPVSIMEAISFGIPVIATDVGGSGEIIDHSCGVLLSPDLKTSDLTLAIETVLSDEKMQNRRCAARNKWANGYSADKNYEVFCQFLVQA